MNPQATNTQQTTNDQPFWSVMIPTYNCAVYLREALKSVLSQDPGMEAMHIEVVDDCSNLDDPETVVREVGGTRVLFHRQPKNCGVTTNLNTCILRSRGRLVHILHGDDVVQSGFYNEIRRMHQACPQAALLATRALDIDANGRVLSISPGRSSEGWLRDEEDLYYSNPFRTPSVVISRWFYEQHEGFNPAYRHVADWELWLRALHIQGGCFSNQPLAGYRTHHINDTGKLARTAENLQEVWKLFLHHTKIRPELSTIRMRLMLGKWAFEQSGRFLAPSDEPAFLANRRFYWQMMGWPAGQAYRTFQWLNRKSEDLLIRLMNCQQQEPSI